MTICIATICDKNTEDPKVILAGDRMITSGLSIEFEHQESKLEKLTEYCAVAIAGDALAHKELFAQVKSNLNHLRSPQIDEIVDCIKDTYVTIREKKIEELYLKPRGIPNIKSFYEIHTDLVREVVLDIQSDIEAYDYGLHILVAGVDDSGPHIHFIQHPGTSVAYDYLGFHAIGIGWPHAFGSFVATKYCSDKECDEALYLTYKAKKMAEIAPGVGSNYTDIWVINRELIKSVDNDTWKELHDIYKEELRNKIGFSDLKEKMKCKSHVGKVSNEVLK